MIYSISSTTRWRTGYETNTVTVALWLIQNERKSSKGNALFPIWALSVSHGINSHTLYAVLQQIPVQNSSQNYTIALSPWTKLLNFFVGVPVVLQPPPPPPPHPISGWLACIDAYLLLCACLRVLNTCVCVCVLRSKWMCIFVKFLFHFVVCCYYSCLCIRLGLLKYFDR